MRLKPFTKIGIIVLVLSILIQAGLFIASKTGVSDDSPVLVMYGFNEEFFPHTSFGKAVHSADFDYAIVDRNLSKVLEVGDEISVPAEYKTRNVVVFVNGNDSTSALKLFDSKDRTLGFILLNPSFETNFSMEGMSNKNPVHDVAIFNSNVGALKDSQIFYERLSGEDTLYGIKYETGGVFSSECYSNPSGNRIISVSGIDYASDSLLLASPIFQIELANYLVSNYGESDDSVNAGIVLWHSLNVFSILLFIAGIILVFAQLNVIKFKVKDDVKQGLYNATLIVTGIVTIALVIITVVLSNIPKSYSSYLFGISCYPILLIVTMAMMRAVFVLKNNRVRVDDKIPAWFKWIMSLSLVVFVVILAINVMGIEAFTTSGVRLIIIIVAFVVDFFSILLLCSADNISRLMAQGGCSYYGKLVFPLLTMIPSVIAIVVFAVSHNVEGVLYAVLGLIGAFIPYIGSVIVKRRMLSELQVATVHSILYLTILILVA